MLTLLKQARAFGLGVVLATQNPVDLDYKGLSNCGTWMLGRLQTERDKMRVLDGLEALESGGFDRSQLDALLSQLAQRTFLLHDVHARCPELFQTRWALSYLRGPLSRDHVKRLSAPGAGGAGVGGGAGVAGRVAGRPGRSPPGRSCAPPPAARDPRVVRRASRLAPRAYRPGLALRASIHYADTKTGVDTWMEPAVLVPLGDDGPRWTDAWWLAEPLAESREPIAKRPVRRPARPRDPREELRRSGRRISPRTS